MLTDLGRTWTYYIFTLLLFCILSLCVILLFIPRPYFSRFFLLCLETKMQVSPVDCCGTCTCDRAQGWACSPGQGSRCCSEFWAHAPADPPGSCPAEWPACVARACHHSGGRGQLYALPPKCSIVPVATQCWAGIAQNMTWLNTVLYLDTKDNIDTSSECYFIAE